VIRALPAAATTLLLLAACATVEQEPALDFAEPLPGATLVGVLGDRPTEVAVADGDLWPSCWAGDGSLYAANGDGAAFGGQAFDAAVSRIDGEPGSLDGETLAGGEQIASVWSGPDFTRKPTGMVCVDGAIYLAVQDLRRDFNEAPAASISVSRDGGITWEWDASAPMFDDHVFTTIMFLDYGQENALAPEGWVYAYGLDGNWRDSFDDSVPDPEDLYLARVPDDRIQDREAWEFAAGLEGGEPVWSSEIDDREPVLTDTRRMYPGDGAADGGTVGASDLSVISQGGVVYVPGLDRYLYTSWTELTFEFYEAPEPWGPWTLFLSRDFGPYPWPEDAFGGYATTIPSKFISDDGRSMWVQSNVCPCAPAGVASYFFGLRELHLGVVG
jgi:hypothetical protein